MPDPGSESDGSDDIPIDTLTSACNQAEISLENQLSILSDIDSKAIRIFRANILLATVLISAISIAVRSGVNVHRFLNLHSFTALVFLLGSIATAGITYAGTSLEVGIGYSSLRRTLTGGPNNKEHLKNLSKGYANWLHYNQLVMQVNGLFSTLTILFSVNAIIFFSTGAMVGVLETDFAGSLISLFAVTAMIVIPLDVLIFNIDSYITRAYESEKIYPEIGEN